MILVINEIILIKQIYKKRLYTSKQEYNNTNMTTYNNTTQTLTLPYTLMQPVISGKQLTFETPEEWTVWHYEDFILSIMKAIDLQYITHCTDNEY